MGSDQDSNSRSRSKTTSVAKSIHSHRGDQEKVKQLVRVEKMSKDVTELHLEEIFRNFGKVIRAFYTANNRKYTIRRFGFVEFESKKSAEDAVKYMHGG